MRTLLLFLALGLSVAACDSTASDPGDPAPELPAIRADSLAGLSPRVFNVYLDPEGRVGHVFLPRDSDLTATRVLYAGALWMSGQQSGALRVAGARYTPSTYGPCLGVESSVFVVDADTAYSPEGWPAGVGAPTAADGSPRAYGDEMAWTTTCPRVGRPFLDRPFEGLRVNVALFGHDEYEHVVFIRYEIRNESTLPITDAYAGFWADPDLGPHWADNLIGYDPDGQFGYVYLAPTSHSGPTRPDSERGGVAAVQVLEAPDAAPVAAHRMMDKGRGSFGAGTIDSAEDYAFALRGFDNDGNPMVDPTTGQPTTFAYPGDPVALTGWLDGFDYCRSWCQEGVQVGEELRQLISAGPFDLAAGETGVFTVAYVVQFGSDLADGLARLRRDMASLRSQPALWQFAPQG